MRRSLRVAVAFAAVALLLPTAALAAPRPPTLGVTFDVHTVFSETQWAFTAAGPAVEAGFICPDGTVADVFFSLIETPRGIHIQIIKQFTCTDGSGTFDVKLQVQLDKRGDHFLWTVVSGTDRYAALHGAGSGFGIAFEGGVEDYYVGQVRLG